MLIQEMFLPFNPVPKGRPRFTRTGHAYTPAKTAKYEKDIAEYYKNNEGTLFENAITVKIIFAMPIPKSFTQKTKRLIATGEYKYTKKPDVDNMAKAVLDALNGVAYTDDSLITHLTVAKHYSNLPGIWLTIKEDI